LLMVSDFNENWYLGVFWSEELVGNDEICIQGHFYEATIFKTIAVRLSWQQGGQSKLGVFQVCQKPEVISSIHDSKSAHIPLKIK
jgi:hypothetical protein